MAAKFIGLSRTNDDNFSVQKCHPHRRDRSKCRSGLNILTVVIGDQLNFLISAGDRLDLHNGRRVPEWRMADVNRTDLIHRT